MDAVFSKSVPKSSFPKLPDPNEKAGRVETLEWHLASRQTTSGFHPFSAFACRSHDPSSSSGQHHAVVNQAQDFNDPVLSNPVDDEVTRAADPARWLSTPTQETDWIGENTVQAGNLDRSDHARVVP